MDETIKYWDTLGRPPRFAFELKNGAIGWCHHYIFKKIGTCEYTAFFAAVVFFRNPERHQAFFVFEVPKEQVKRIEVFETKSEKMFKIFRMFNVEGEM